MPEFRPDDHPTPPRLPNAECLDCGWLAEIVTHREAGPCRHCGADHWRRLSSGTGFIQCACGTPRLVAGARCKGCGRYPEAFRAFPDMAEKVDDTKRMTTDAQEDYAAHGLGGVGSVQKRRKPPAR